MKKIPTRLKTKHDTQNSDDNNQTIISHLVELRGRLLKIALLVGIIFIVLFPFANPIYNYVSQPLLENLPQDSSMVAIDVASPFLTPFKLIVLLSIILAIPVIFYQVWAFISPGLYPREQKLVFPLLILSTMLFYLGMVFAYYVAFPLMFAFFNAVAPPDVKIMTDIGRYLDFVIKIFIAFGLAFEVPIITMLLALSGVASPEKMKQKRPYIIVGAFVAGMILTPPDVISQILLAVPIWLLFELGLLISQRIVKNRNEKTIS